VQYSGSQSLRLGAWHHAADLGEFPRERKERRRIDTEGGKTVYKEREESQSHTLVTRNFVEGQDNRFPR
jgi:hypothetical protein